MLGGNMLNQRGLITTFFSILAFFFVVGAPVVAGELYDNQMDKHFPAIDETRLGVFATNLEDSEYDDGPIVINGELLFGRVGYDYAEPWKQFLFNPRPHIGFSVNPHDDGVSQVYAGFTWDYNLTKTLFFEGAFGGTLHNGDDAAYGCNTLFHESASLGLKLTERLRLVGTIEHSSHAGLCGDQNKGLTNAGLRLGYKW
jgi:hypothetical protein